MYVCIECLVPFIRRHFIFVIANSLQGWTLALPHLPMSGNFWGIGQLIHLHMYCTFNANENVCGLLGPQPLTVLLLQKKTWISCII